jgi:hypothetical protein
VFKTWQVFGREVIWSQILSTAKVLRELNDGNDDDQVKLWANQLLESFFVPDVHDALVMQA